MLHLCLVNYVIKHESLRGQRVINMITFITITYINDCYISINITLRRLTVLKTLHFMASDSRNEKCVSLAYKFLILLLHLSAQLPIAVI